MPPEAFPPGLGVPDHLFPTHKRRALAVFGCQIQRPAIGDGLYAFAGADARAGR